MSYKTPTLGLWVQTDADPIDINLISESFETIDGLIVCTKVSDVSVSDSFTTKWHKKEYTDGTVELSTIVETSEFPNTVKKGNLYISNNIEITLPVTVKKYLNVQVTLATSGDTYSTAWVINKTPASELNKLVLVTVSNEQEPSKTFKQFHIRLECEV